MTLLGNKVVGTDVIKMRSSSSVTGVNTDGRTRGTPCGDEGRDQEDALTNQGPPQITMTTRSQEKSLGQILPRRTWKEPTSPTP